MPTSENVSRDNRLSETSKNSLDEFLNKNLNSKDEGVGSETHPIGRRKGRGEAEDHELLF
jgi:hypothetical protein